MTILSKAYQEAMDKINKRVDDAIKTDGQEKIYVQYSAYEYDVYDNPVDNLDEVPLSEKFTLVDKGDSFDWKHEMDGTENPYKPFESKVMDSPTWLEIAVEANRMINTTYNGHQIYLEDIRYDEERDVMVFVMGS